MGFSVGGVTPLVGILAGMHPMVARLSRKHGKGSRDGIGALGLERDGSPAVLGLDDLGDGSALADVLPDLRP